MADIVKPHLSDVHKWKKQWNNVCWCTSIETCENHCLFIHIYGEHMKPNACWRTSMEFDDTSIEFDWNHKTHTYPSISIKYKSQTYVLFYVHLCNVCAHLWKSIETRYINKRTSKRHSNKHTTTIVVWFASMEFVCTSMGFDRHTSNKHWCTLEFSITNTW